MRRAALLLCLAACQGASPAGDSASAALQLPPADAERLLDFVNYPGTDEALLDGAVGLDARAAKNIINVRNGADGVSPSADDHAFATLTELDGVAYVGDTALSRLASYSTAHPAPAGETVESVSFSGWQSQAVVFGVNQATTAELNAFLDSRAATALVAKRPFTSVTAMGPVSYVGTSALTALRSQANSYWAKMMGSASLAGSFDSVVFDEATAEVALEIANDATYDQMVSHGVPQVGAAPIVGNRPYTTLAQVGAVGGVGTATMKGLHSYAASGQWGVTPPADCVASFSDAVSPYLPALLFLSESDRPLNVVSYPGKGTTALTAASFFALLAPGSGWSYESRDPSNYYIDFEPASSTADPNAGAAVQAAIAAQLTGVIYVAVHKPAGDPYQAEVDVYLIGRTACGDLVGLHAISVET